ACRHAGGRGVWPGDAAWSAGPGELALAAAVAGYRAGDSHRGALRAAGRVWRAGSACLADDQSWSAGPAGLPPTASVDALVAGLCCGGGRQPWRPAAGGLLVVLHGGRTVALWHGGAPGLSVSLVALGAGTVGRIRRSVALADVVEHAGEPERAAGQRAGDPLGEPVGGAGSPAGYGTAV